jgi:hypothetical protein
VTYCTLLCLSLVDTGTLLAPLKQWTRKDCHVSKYLLGGQKLHRLPQCVLVNTDQ